MQKFPGAQDRKRGDVCIKKKEWSREKKESRFPSAETTGVTTLKYSLSCARLKTTPWLTFPLVAGDFFINDPRLKTPNN